MNKKGQVLSLGLLTVAGMIALTILLLFGIGGLFIILNFTALRIAGIVMLSLAGLAIFFRKGIDMPILILLLIGGFFTILPYIMNR